MTARIDGVFLVVSRATAYFGKPVQVSIDDVDASGAGVGYRIAGPKYSGAESEDILVHRITERDIKEIRAYLRIAARRLRSSETGRK